MECSLRFKDLWEIWSFKENTFKHNHNRLKTHYRWNTCGVWFLRGILLCTYYHTPPCHDSIYLISVINKDSKWFHLWLAIASPQEPTVRCWVLSTQPQITGFFTNSYLLFSSKCQIPCFTEAFLGPWINC